MENKVLRDFRIKKRHDIRLKNGRKNLYAY